MPELPVLTVNLILILIIIGIAGSCLQLSFTYAFKYGEAIVLAPIRYLSVLEQLLPALLFGMKFQLFRSNWFIYYNFFLYSNCLERIDKEKLI